MRLGVRVCVLGSLLGGLLVAIPSAAEPVGEGTAKPCTPRDKCCEVCTVGKACGKSCIQASKTCHKGRGCSCNASEVCEGT